VNRRHVSAVGCWVLLTILVGWRCFISASHPVKARTLDADAPPAPSEHERIRERKTLEFQSRQRVAELAKLEKEQQKQTELVSKQRERLTRLQMALANAWSNVLSTNWTAYQGLRRKAAGSVEKTAPCTICDGRGAMLFCVVCGNVGKCIDCNGKGKTPYGERCPTCRGRGTCYLCRGSGQMPCLFCDDGLVYSDGVPPPTKLPLPAGAAPLKQAPLPTPAIQHEPIAPSAEPEIETPTQPAPPTAKN
jgi:hypothetical protein